MKIQPLQGPMPVTQATGDSQATSAAKARATAMLTAAPQQPPQQTVQNQNAISAEEMGAIQPQVPKYNGQEAVSEDTSVETKAAEPQVPDETNKKFIQLAKQEKQLRLRQQQLAQQEQQWKAKEAELRAREEALTNQPKFDTTQYISKDRFLNDPVGVMEETGLTYDQLTQKLLNPVQTDPRMQAMVQKLEAKIAELEKQTENTQKTYQEQQTAQYQAAIKQIEADVKSLVYTDPSFEAIKAAKATKDVVQLIEETYKQDGVLLSVEDAAKQVEDFLTEEYTKLANINKIKQRIAQASAPRAQTTSVKTPEQQPKQQQPMKTLTNATSSSRQLTAREKAILAFKGELK